MGVAVQRGKVRMAKTLKVLKWLGIGFAAIVVLLLVAIYGISQYHISRSWSPEPIAQRALVQGDPVEGKRLAAIYGCSGCHRRNLQGGTFVDEPLMGKVYASNLTRKLEQYSETEMSQAIRQGMRPDGSGFVIMPSNAFAVLTDEEVADLLAYAQTIPVGGEDYPTPKLGPIARAFLAMGEFKTAPAMAEAAQGNMPWFIEGHEEGRRLVYAACSECHGTDLTGEPLAGSPDLAIGAAYDLADFTKLMRTGKGAGGRDLGLMSEVAKGRFVHFTEEEIGLIHAYLVERAEKIPAD